MLPGAVPWRARRLPCETQRPGAAPAQPSTPGTQSANVGQARGEVRQRTEGTGRGAGGATMRQELYAANLRTRREAALLRSEGQCEHLLTDEHGNAVRCPNRIGVFKISHAHNPCFEQLHLHHPNGDPENPNAEVLLYCSSCHMKMNRNPGTTGQEPPRKQDYQ